MKAKYTQGSIVGPHNCQLISRDPNNHRYATFMNLDTHDTFYSRIDKVSTGIIYSSSQQHSMISEGIHTGNHVNSDGTIGLLVVKRLYDSRGHLLDKLIVKCPECGKEFETYTSDINKGRIIMCPDCALANRTKYKQGEYIGTFSNGDDLPDGMMIIDRKKNSFRVVCPKCHTETVLTKSTLITAKATPCKICQWNEKYGMPQ